MVVINANCDVRACFNVSGAGTAARNGFTILSFVTQAIVTLECARSCDLSGR